MISVNGIKKEFGGIPLFSRVGFNINPKDRIGLAGKNGSGKTTLLNILVGNIPMDEGSVVIPDDVSVGYLPQEKNLNSSVSVIEEILLALSFMNEWQKKLTSLENELAERNDYHTPAYAKLIEKYNHLNDRILLFQPDKLRGEAERILLGLGFTRKDFNNAVSTLSVGWQMRIELGKLLLLKPELLLLDEPTNHLDIESIQWLENFLLAYNGAVIIVSHDRAFLDNVTNRTLEINNGKVYDYKVPYSAYVKLRNERLEQQKAAYTNQQKEVKEIEQFIEKFRYKATKARQVQSRVKQLDRMERVQVEDLDKSAIHFKFPDAPHSGKVTIQAKGITKYYDDKLVLENIDFQLLRGEKVAFVGKNGEGKTTLVKILLGLTGYNGEVKSGHQVVTAYYTQDQLEMLNVENTVFEEVDEIAVGEVRNRLKNILGSFLFRGDEVDKKIRVLSGGEKSRLALAKLLLSPSNLLILDEPTNHLDMVSKDILKRALLDYSGSVIIVSHDRDFLQGLTTKVYEFKNHSLKEHIGDISEYLRKHRLETLKELEKNSLKQIVRKEQPLSENKIRYEQRREKERLSRKLKNRIAVVEDNIEKMEEELSILNKKLSTPDEYREEITSGLLYKQHKNIEERLQEAMNQWEQLHEQLEKM